MRTWVSSIFVLFALLFTPLHAFAYIGPGLGSGAIGAVLAILAGFCLLLVGAVWYPLKRLIAFFRKKKND